MTTTIDVLGSARAWAARLTRRGSSRPGATGDVHRFDGERPFVTRGGASVGEVKASWSLAELSISSTEAIVRSRPRGLFDEVRIDREEVRTIGVRPGELGVGITFAGVHPDVVFWPTEARDVLAELHDRGWPVPAAA